MCHQIGAHPQQILQEEFQVHVAIRGGPAFELDQEIRVALGPILPPGHLPKKRQRSDPQPVDLGALCGKELNDLFPVHTLLQGCNILHSDDIMVHNLVQPSFLIQSILTFSCSWL
jgi:hypothetical protein